MRTTNSVSILICTYNRAGLLEQTLAALTAATVPPFCELELVVVDNNSTDATREVVHRVSAAAPWPVRYIVEARQGKSFALNRGLSEARGDIIALTDDDVLPAADWLARIVERFRAHDIEFVFGKVLPIWERLPPPEMLTVRARDIWGPLALVDYGDELDCYDEKAFHKKRLPIGANLALRRETIERLGGWRTDLGKVDNTLISGEDHELLVRLFKAGLFSGVYDPAIEVRHFVPAARMTRRYFRRWFYWHGRTLARMPEAVYVNLDLAEVPHVTGVPRFVYRAFLVQIRRWLSRVGRTAALPLLMEELALIEYFGLFREIWFGPRTQPARRGDMSRRESVPVSTDCAGSQSG